MTTNPTPSPTPCTLCSGSGQVLDYYHPSDWETVPCPDCWGTGHGPKRIHACPPVWRADGSAPPEPPGNMPEEAPARDICTYCGADQGIPENGSPVGPLRQGWDCHRGCGN